MRWERIASAKATYLDINMGGFHGRSEQYEYG